MGEGKKMHKKRSRSNDDSDEDKSLVAEANSAGYERLEKQVQKMLNKKLKRTNTEESGRLEDFKKSDKKSKTIVKEESIKKVMPKSISSSTQQSPSAVSNNAYNNDRTVYIAGLPFTATEDDIRQFFSSASAKGEIKSIRLPKWHDTGNLKGYGHVEFSSKAGADVALTLSGEYIKERFITVDRPMTPRALQEGGSNASSEPVSKPAGCRTIFIKNLPYDLTENEIREKFMVYGPIEKVRLAVWNHTSNLKGFGYIDFKREDSAEIAVKKSGSIILKDRNIKVDYETGAPKRGYKGFSQDEKKRGK